VPLFYIDLLSVTCHYKFGPFQYSPSGKPMSASSMIIPIFHLPLPGHQFSFSTFCAPLLVPSLANNASSSETSCLVSHQPSDTLELPWYGVILHHRSVPGSSPSAPFPSGKGGCTRSRSTPIYFAILVDAGKLGTYGIGLNVPLKNGVFVLSSSGVTVIETALSGSPVKVKRARCFGIFQSVYINL